MSALNINNTNFRFKFNVKAFLFFSTFVILSILSGAILGYSLKNYIFFGKIQSGLYIAAVLFCLVPFLSNSILEKFHMNENAFYTGLIRLFSLSYVLVFFYKDIGFFNYVLIAFIGFKIYEFFKYLFIENK